MWAMSWVIGSWGCNEGSRRMPVSAERIGRAQRTVCRVQPERFELDGRCILLRLRMGVPASEMAELLCWHRLLAQPNDARPWKADGRLQPGRT